MLHCWLTRKQLRKAQQPSKDRRSASQRVRDLVRHTRLLQRRSGCPTRLLTEFLVKGIRQLMRTNESPLPTAQSYNFHGALLLNVQQHDSVTSVMVCTPPGIVTWLVSNNEHNALTSHWSIDTPTSRPEASAANKIPESTWGRSSSRCRIGFT